MAAIIRTVDAAGERIDAFLARTVEDLTRSAAQRLLEEGRVCVNGAPVKKKNLRRAGRNRGRYRQQELQPLHGLGRCCPPAAGYDQC